MFMAAGSVIAAMAGTQNIDRMSGLRRAMPFTYVAFLVAALALAAFPGCPGYFSKDEILAFAAERGGGYWILYVGGHAGGGDDRVLRVPDRVPGVLGRAQRGGARARARPPAPRRAGQPDDRRAGGHGRRLSRAPSTTSPSASRDERADGDPRDPLGGRRASLQIPGVTHVIESFLDPTFEDSRFADDRGLGRHRGARADRRRAQRAGRHRRSRGCMYMRRPGTTRGWSSASAACTTSSRTSGTSTSSTTARSCGRRWRSALVVRTSSSAYVVGGMVAGTALAVRAGNQVVRVAQSGSAALLRAAADDRRHRAGPLLPGGEPLMLTRARSSCRSPAACWPRCCPRARGGRAAGMVSLLFALATLGHRRSGCSADFDSGGAASSTSPTSTGSPSSASTTSSALDGLNLFLILLTALLWVAATVGLAAARLGAARASTT